MTDSNVQLMLDPTRYQRRPQCRCGLAYIVQQRFAKAVATSSNGLVVRFADPERGFAGGWDEEFPIPSEEQDVFGLEVEALGISSSKAILLDILLSREDIITSWRRLRALLAVRFRHPKRLRSRECLENTFALVTPPRTFYHWAEPLFTVLYGFGLTCREIMQTDVAPFGLGSTDEAYSSIARAVHRNKDDTLREQHRKNRGALYCTGELRGAGDGFSWTIEVHGNMNQITREWLEAFALAHNSVQTSLPYGPDRGLLQLSTAP